jgi:hypothetical protein
VRRAAGFGRLRRPGRGERRLEIAQRGVGVVDLAVGLRLVLAGAGMALAQRQLGLVQLGERAGGGASGVGQLALEERDPVLVVEPGAEALNERRHVKSSWYSNEPLEFRRGV